jgi:hypothetical protein
MALHRDIYWVGKQWAVTGYGVQACDQKQKSKFDIEVGRLWQDDVLESLRAHKWLNAEDLGQALAIARQRFPRLDPVEPAAAPVALQALPIVTADPELPKPTAPKFQMLFSGDAKFIRPWRVRMRV